MKFGKPLIQILPRRYFTHKTWHAAGGLKAQRQFTRRLKKLILFATFGGSAYLLYVRFFQSEIELIYQDTEANREIVASIRELKSRVYQKTIYFPLRFMEIIYGSIYDEGAFVEYEREIIHTKDGENLAVGELNRLAAFARDFRRFVGSSGRF